ncbi:MAG: hypothetical protein MUF54_14025 [Polyangiaceae bacterium]|nr:hypothetical protein [Polyangiaceae bacterium]
MKLARQAGATDAELAEAIMVSRLMKMTTGNDTAVEALAWLGSEKKYIHTNPWLALVAVFVCGILTASIPCVLAMIPLMRSLVAGRKEDKPGGSPCRRAIQG